jgi:DNA-binding XRE family transcriptional regulator
MDKSREEKIIEELISEFTSLRLKIGLSRNALAKKAGISRPAVSLIENGKRTPTLLLCLKIADALGKNLCDTLAVCEHKADKQ